MLLRSVLAWELTDDEMALAYINLATAVCMFAVSLVSGVIIDRCERRLMILMAQSVVLLAEGGILVLLLLDRLTFELLLLSAVAASLAFPFIMPARTAMLVDTVGKAPLVKATAVLSAGMNIARTMSPALVGFLADWSGFIPCYVLLVGLHLLSILCTVCLERYPPRDNVRSSFLNELLEGYRYVFQHRSLAMAMIFGILPMLIVVPLQNMMVVFVSEIWDAGGSGLGIMLATMGVGGIVGSMLMALLPDGSLTRPMAISTIWMGAFLLLFAHSSNFWLAVAMVTGISGCSVVSQTLVQSAVQLMSDDYIRGRITTITLVSVSLSPVGTIPLAYAVKHFGAEWGLTVAAIMLTLAVLLVWRMSPAFRAIDSSSQIDLER